MKDSRRKFLQVAAGTVAAAGATRWIGCAAPQPPPTPALEGATGVELLVGEPGLPDYSHDLEKYLTRISNEARATRKRAIAAITTPSGLSARQKSVRDELWSILGGPFETTPLNPRVTGVLERQGYRIEKTVFESRPRLYVTANLYVPSAPGRHPAILGPLGHGTTGKASHTYQKLFANLARKGYVVLAYDPFGQGERIEYPGGRPGESLLGGGTSEHEHAGRRLILLGANMSLFRAWDGIRGVDYLVTRPEVDPDRIGCAGQSGGGLMTQFLTALEDRIKVAVVSEGNTEDIASADVEPPGSADDAEQNIVPSLAHGLDRADLLQVFAPRPLLMMVTLHDAGHTYSPEYVAGSIEMRDELKTFYALHGAADRIALQATTQRHGLIYELRRATYAWFNRWFDVAGEDDAERSQDTERDEALFVTRTGFVTTSLGGETALSMTRQMAIAVTTPSAPPAPELRARLETALALPTERGPLQSRVLSRIRKPGYRAEQFEFTSDHEIRIPGWLLTPDAATSATPTVLYVGEPSAWASVAEEAFAEVLCAQGTCRVAVIDVRGRGDCAIAYPPRGRFYFPGRIPNEAYLAWFSLVLGRPLLGGQVFDILRAADYLRGRGDLSPGDITLMGDGPHGVAALFAAALDEKARGAILRGTLTDYRSLAIADRYTQPFGIYLFGVLKAFDVPEVAASLAPRPLLVLNPAGPQGERATEAAVRAYGRAANTTVRVLGPEDDGVAVVADWAKPPVASVTDVPVREAEPTLRSGADMHRRTLLLMLPVAARVGVAPRAQGVPEYDVVIYGGTAAAISAAVQATRLGKSVIVVSPDRHLGGLSSGGLGFTDTGDKGVIGGLAREFYRRVWQHYQAPDAWRWERREDFGNKGQGTPAIDGENRTMWIFEPHVAERVFEDLVGEHRLRVVRDEWLDRASGVMKAGARITSIRTLSGRTYTGRMFIDATYEGDLMAAAGVRYHVGREATTTYGERWNGVQTGVLHHRHHFGAVASPISPYIVPGDRSSGVLPRISTRPPGAYGAGDDNVQAYCFRMCLTDRADNRVPFARPAGYDPAQYALLLRIFNAGWRETFQKFDRIPNRKTDTNNHGPFSTDNIGMSSDYPDGSYERRREIVREHEQYQKGLLYFIATDPRVPKDVQDAFTQWGLAADEFTDNGHWPHQIYVREARRMIGAYVMTEHGFLKSRPTPDPVGMGSYGIDSHNIQRYITPDGFVQNEGDIGVSTNGPYQIAYGSLVPRKGQADNLLVPVCVSSSHIAFGSIRMEPVFMILGQSAATAAVLAIDGDLSVQDVPYARLRARLLQDQQVLAVPAPPAPAR